MAWHTRLDMPIQTGHASSDDNVTSPVARPRILQISPTQASPTLNQSRSVRHWHASTDHRHETRYLHAHAASGHQLAAPTDPTLVPAGSRQKTLQYHLRPSPHMSLRPPYRNYLRSRDSYRLTVVVFMKVQGPRDAQKACAWMKVG